MKEKIKTKKSPTKKILVGLLVVILIGGLLLKLPISNVARKKDNLYRRIFYFDFSSMCYRVSY